MKIALEWFNHHFKAIVGTAILVSKAGLLGKAGSVFLSSLAVACGVM